MEELYDKICRVLTDYENDESLTVYEKIQDMYEVLVEVQNKWEELTAKE